MKRFKTSYPGVYYILGISPATGKQERIYYVRYRKTGKMTEEKAGRQIEDAMTPARASALRAEKISGKKPTNTEQRKAELDKKNQTENRWTVDRIWEEYQRQKPDLKGWPTYRSFYNRHLKKAFGEKAPKEIIQLDVDRLRLKLLKKRSPQTVKHVLSQLQRVLNFGIRKKLCGPLLFEIELPTVHNIKTEDLNAEQLDRLLKAIEVDTHPQAGPMMKLALYTGMRRGEMFKLKWNDIKWEQGFINIRDPKGGPDQKIPLNDPARELLRDHPKISEFVFPGRGGRQRVGIAKAVNEIKKAAGLPKDFRPLHGLRHVYASMLASSGQVDIYTLQKLLTHKSPLMTQRYAHLRDEALIRASELAGSIIQQATGDINKSNIQSS